MKWNTTNWKILQTTPPPDPQKGGKKKRINYFLGESNETAPIENNWLEDTPQLSSHPLWICMLASNLHHEQARLQFGQFCLCRCRLTFVPYGDLTFDQIPFERLGITKSPHMLSHLTAFKTMCCRNESWQEGFCHFMAVVAVGIVIVVVVIRGGGMQTEGKGRLSFHILD